MTCEEFRALIPKAPIGITNAEFAAGIVHVETCIACRTWGRNIRDMLAAQAGPVLAAECREAGRARREKVLQDPECREIVSQVITLEE